MSSSFLLSLKSLLEGGVFALFWAVNTARPLVPALVKGIHLFGFENYLKLNSIKKNYFRIVLDTEKLGR